MPQLMSARPGRSGEDSRVTDLSRQRASANRDFAVVTEEVHDDVTVVQSKLLQRGNASVNRPKRLHHFTSTGPEMDEDCRRDPRTPRQYFEQNS